MNKPGSKITESVSGIVSQVIELVGFIRLESAKLRIQHLVLLMISLKKEGVLNERRSDEIVDHCGFIENKIKSLKGENVEAFSQLFKILRPDFEQISEQSFDKLLKVLDKVDSKLLNDYFSSIFEAILYKLAAAQGRQSGKWMLPAEISRLASRIAELPENARVFNPFAGIASFSIFLKGYESYYAQENDAATLALSRLRLYAHQLNDLQMTAENSLLNWPVARSFDLVISSPPYPFKSLAEYPELYKKYRRLENFFIGEGMNLLSDRGKLIAVIPPGGLYEPSTLSTRKRLIESDLLDIVVRLPNALLYGTAVPTVMIVLNKKKKVPGVVRFIDGRDFSKPGDSRVRVLDDYKLADLILDSRDSSLSNSVPSSEIRKANYNLNPSRYFHEELPGGIALSEILQPIKGMHTPKFMRGKIVMVRNLKDDFLNYILTESELHEVEFRSPSVRKVEESCLLLSSVGNSMRPTYLKYTGNPMYLRREIACFKVDESRINLGYLFYVLHSKAVIQQLRNYGTWGSVSHIKRKDILQIRIPVPPMDIQNAKMEGVLELAEQNRSLRQEMELLNSQQQKHAIKQILQLEHVLRKPVHKIVSSTRMLKRFFSGYADIEQINKHFFEITQGNSGITDSLEGTIASCDMIDKLMNGTKKEVSLDLDAFPLRIVTMKEIHHLIQSLDLPDKTFQITNYLLEDDGLKKRGVKINEQLFEVLILAIMENANTHGFTRGVEGNEVVIDLTEDGPLLVLEIRNNGKPFPENFGKDEFIKIFSTSGSVSGTGLGGYEINKIAIHFGNPNWSQILDKHSIYPVRFRFQFPVVPNI